MYDRKNIAHVKRVPMPLPIMQTSCKESIAKILCILNFIAIVNLQMRILSLFIYHHAVASLY